LLLPFASLLLLQFRQEYRLERKVLNELSIDPETFPGDEEDLSNLVSAATSSPTSSTVVSSRDGGSPHRHRISRVVVLHNDKLETFFNYPEADCGSGDFLSSLIRPSTTAGMRRETSCGSYCDSGLTGNIHFRLR
jgi:hypothetical protein